VDGRGQANEVVKAHLLNVEEDGGTVQILHEVLV
jgi:hypothetical protein